MAIPNHAKQQALAAWLQGSTVKVALGDNSTDYTYDPAGHQFVGDVFDGGTTATEMSGTGYSRKTLDTSASAFSQDDTDNEGVWDAGDVTWSGLDAGTIQFILIYKQVGGDDQSPGDDPIVLILDDDSAGSLSDLPRQTSGIDETIEWSTEGIWNHA